MKKSATHVKQQYNIKLRSNASLWEVLGPIALSALSFFVSMQVIEPLAQYLNPTWTLFANKGVGKFALSTMAIMQIFLFLLTRTKNFLKFFLERCVFFVTRTKCHITTLKLALIFFGFHAIIQGVFSLLGYSYIALPRNVWNVGLIASIVFGFFIAFLLAWSEELIFRGLFYSYFVQYWHPLVSIIITSFLFTIAHDITNPLHLLVNQFKLALGLFLLGIFINLLFLATQKLYVGIGAHMGLVWFKVLMRRIPFVFFVTAYESTKWIDPDLRQSYLVHVLFAIAIGIMLIKTRHKLFHPTPAQEQTPSNQ